MVSIEVCIPSRDGRIDDDVLMQAHAACSHAMREGISCNLTRVKDSYTVAACRNRGVAGFLSRNYSHLLFLDDDVLLPATAVTLLAKAAETFDGILCGCVPSIRIDKQGNVSAYVQVLVKGEWLATWPKENVDGEACGGGCMMIPKGLIEKMDFPWFRWPETYTPGIGVKAITDDTDFCGRAGVIVRALAGVRCGHKKTVDVAMLIGDA